MTPDPDDQDDLRPTLDALAERGADAVARRGRPRARREALASALPWLVVVPGVALVLQLLRFGAHNGPIPWSAADFVIGTLASFALAWLWFGVVARPPRVSRGAGLAVADRTMRAKDRLIAADEFLRKPSGELTPFERAAVADAKRFAARRTDVAPGSEDSGGAGARLARDAFLWSTCAVVLLALVLPLNRIDVARPPLSLSASAPPVLPEGELGESLRDEERETARPADPPRSKKAEPRAKRPAAERAESDEPEPSPVGEVTAQAKESRGKTSAGKSAPARSISGASESRGVPTNRAPASKEPPKDQAPKKKKSKPKPPGDDARSTKKAPAEQSGATAGRGAAKGSNRNPAATDWASKDQVTTEDDEDLPDDEDVEDESEEDEARGGVQPHMRDRRPPVSRDLQIGFGNNASPDANQRGGPSQQKKSRGTASLVLGVPIPDRVKGQPNPGRTKVTQERVEPRREDAPAIDAQERTERTGALGPVARPELPPWLRRLLKNYTETLRAAERGEP